MNIDRLGPITTLILIDHLQQFVRSGLLLNLNKRPQLKQYLIQFIEHIQTGRLIGLHLYRLVEQMNNSIKNNTIKKALFIKQLNILLKQIYKNNENKKLKNHSDELISILMNLAYQGQLNTYTNININIKQQSKLLKEKTMTKKFFFNT